MLMPQGLTVSAHTGVSTTSRNGLRSAQLEAKRQSEVLRPPDFVGIPQVMFEAILACSTLLVDRAAKTRRVLTNTCPTGHIKRLIRTLLALGTIPAGVVWCL